MHPPLSKRLNPSLPVLAATGGWLTLLLLLTLVLNSSDARATTPTPPTSEQQVSAQFMAALGSADERSHVSRPALSPDGRFAAVTIVPRGTETAALARTELYDLATNQVRQTIPGFTPRWLDGGATLQVETLDRALLRYTIEATTTTTAGAAQPIATLAQSSVGSTTRAVEPAPLAPVQFDTATYPTTIRVAHHPSNGCRDVPAWQVDTIPFEEYVARVVPAESPAWWPQDALAAQAVAVRSYAWRQILVGRADYDVTDWANFQMMCDTRYPNSDTAVAMTQGQYLVEYADQAVAPISAMYSAENGHPTLTNSNVSYLQSVPDHFALGRTRWGHGYGLSQWGAYRRALAGQSYRHILGHYYSNIYLRNGLAPTVPLGILLAGDPPHHLATGSIALRTLRWPGLAVRYAIAGPQGLTATIVSDDTGDHDAALLWRTPTPLAETAQLTASLWISDQLQEVITWVVDNSPPPPPTVTLPAVITTTAVTLTLPAATGTPLLSAGWQWPGPALEHTVNSGAVISDSAGATGSVWAADPTQHSAGVWYGPYTTALPAGHSYRALFWLRSALPATTTVVATPLARLDVTDEGGNLHLGLRDLYASDFADATSYQPIAVDFHLFTAPTGLEFRVAWPGTVALALDRVEIWQLPDQVAETTASFGWSMAGYGLTQLVQVRATDDAGNLSAQQQYTLTVVDQEPPTFGAVTGPSGWTATRSVTLTTIVVDALSGIDLSTGALEISGDDFVSRPPVKLNRQGESPLRATMSAVIHDLPDGRYTATFTAYDQAGNRAVQAHSLAIDSVAPTVLIEKSGQPSADWYLEPLQLTAQVTDQGSGVQTVYYTQQRNDQAAGAPLIYTAPLLLTQGGHYTTTVWAIDQAANQSSAVHEYVQLDLAPPTLLLTQTAVNSTTVHITWQAADDGSGVAAVDFAVQRDGGTWESMPASAPPAPALLELPVDPEQPTRLRGRAQDQVGRLSEWVEIELWVPTDWLYLPVVRR